ncbi:CerR family C-terminal domain-containing protein [Salinisphaera hydrothermalis]|uniref:TetR family transcriptional regulator n=1 Tax=Salinisphaera hydrothermalis (strain C41B8) TaxID=1304275 RepID=A0A084IKS1_SALHC|nr:CerR family C-terminal domain-containing protein [Salinisphaera hydrothermalis]KEZ77305.1 TetR family transcriptional regulator [Salinisphaera hydrothermalis C41B8]
MTDATVDGSRTMTMPVSDRSTRGDLTRDTLLQAAMQAFAAEGYDKVSLRALAARAGVNQSLIGYHFGHKQGLYRAVFVEIAARIRARLDPEMAAVEAALSEGEGARDRAADFDALFRLTDGVLALMTGPGSDAWARLIMREQQRPTEAFDILYDGFMGRFLDLVERLVARLAGPIEPEAARVLALTVLGQILVFRSARASVLRAMSWRDIDAAAMATIRTALHRNLQALLAAAPP